ncbi:MAG: Ig-like domain-containing protein [Thermoleophilia bacterium]
MPLKPSAPAVAVATLSLAALAPSALAAAPSTILPTPADVAAPAGGVGAAQAINLGAAAPGVTYEVAVPPRNGVVQDAAPTDPGVLYTPNPGFQGTDAFWYRVRAGEKLSALALVTITVSPGPPIPSPAILFADGFESDSLTPDERRSGPGRWSSVADEPGTSVSVAGGRGNLSRFAMRAVDGNNGARSAWVIGRFAPAGAVTVRADLRIDRLRLGRNQMRSFLRLGSGARGKRFEIVVFRPSRGPMIWAATAEDRRGRFRFASGKGPVPLHRYVAVEMRTDFASRAGGVQLLVDGAPRLTLRGVDMSGVTARKVEAGLLYTGRARDNATISMDNVRVTAEGIPAR